MKVTIVKYLNPKGKVVEMRKDNFKGSYMPENIIEEYEVEIKGGNSVETDWWLEEWLEGLKRKYATGNYILLTPNALIRDTNKWIIVQKPLWDCDNYMLIHNKHKDILEAYLKNPSVEIETGRFESMTVKTEPSKWVDLEKDFIEDYNEEFWYRLKEKDSKPNVLLEYDLETNFKGYPFEGIAYDLADEVEDYFIKNEFARFHKNKKYKLVLTLEEY